ncbi:MAG: acetylglutamate kinase [Candidatus Hydrothermarchaeota archaeon]|nr:MAG: acetylglutamate kinase [Candidatus Hydrothermarchaeota archaeon]
MKKTKRAEILAEALPYIKEFHGSYIVIKYGGHAMIDEKAKAWTIEDTILLKYIGMKPVIVHGGGPEITKAMEKLGKKPKFIEGLRVTDKETLEIVKMVLVGKINTDIVSKINAMGGNAVGLSGKDAQLIIAEKKAPLKIISEGVEKEVDLGYVGEPKRVNPEIIEILTSHGYIPVVSPLGLTEGGDVLNLNADTVAGEIASALKAKKLIILTDVPGVLRDLEDESTLLKEIKKEEVKDLIEQKIIKGSMLPKIKACVKALDNGVEKTHIIDGRVKHSILLELFTYEGIGTMII